MASDVPEYAADCGHSVEAVGRYDNTVSTIDYLMVDMQTPSMQDMGVCFHELVVPR
jgi:hypothetical protein